MRTIEKLRKEYSTYERWYYHLILDSLGERNLLNDRSQRVNAMNIVAVAQHLYGIAIVQFDWMRNHGHFVLYANGDESLSFFDYIKRRLNARLVKDGYPPLPEDWFMKLVKLVSLNQLVNAVTYSGRNAYDARDDVLPSGYLWSSNYLIFSEINELFECRTIASLGPVEARRILGSKVILPPDYKICKLGFVLPESYLMRTHDGRMTKAMSLYKDSKEYSYKMFRDYNTYKRTAADADEAWSPSGGDIDSIIDGMITYGYGAGKIEGLKMEQRYDLAVALSTRFGIAPDLVAAKLGVSLFTVDKMIYSFNKKNH